MRLPQKTSIIIASLSLFLLTTTKTLASEFKLVVSPPSTNINAQPGEFIQKTIKVTNNSTTQITISQQVSDFIVQDDQGTPIKVAKEASGRYLASPWFTLSEQKITIEPQETIALTVLIDVPADALPGGHYAGVFFSQDTGNKPGTTGAQIMPEVGSLFSITIPGDINYDAQITSFTTNAPIFEYGPVSFQAIISNESDTHITTTPTLKIKDMLGRTLYTEDLATTNIFPFTSRSFEATWDQVFGFGRYTAELTAAYGNNYVTSRVLYFWIIPYTLIMTALVIILVLIVLIILIRRRKKHTEDKRDEEIDLLKRRLIELENHQ